MIRLALCLLLLLPAPAWAVGPHVPESGDSVIARFPAQPGEAAQAVRDLSARLAAAPDDEGAAARLVAAYLWLARRDGVTRYLDYADELLAGFPAPAPPALEVARARILLARGDAGAARAAARQALAQAPGDPGASLLLARLDPAEAGQYCPALPAGPGRALCEALAAPDGDDTRPAEAAAAELDNELQASPRLEPELASEMWLARARLAGRLEDGAAAEAVLRRALDGGLEDAPLRAALADLLMARQDWDGALDVLSWNIRPDPILLRTVLAAERSGEPAPALARGLVERLAAEARAGGPGRAAIAAWLEAEGARPAEAAALLAAFDQALPGP